METQAPGTDPKVETQLRAALPSRHMLVDSSYALEQLGAMEQRLFAAQAGVPLGEVAGSQPLVRHIPAANLGPLNGRQLQGKSFAHIKLEGLMVSRPTWYSAGVGGVVEAIQNAYADPKVAGLLFEVNTGGGEVTAGQMVAAAIKDRPKPVVTLGHLVASGGIMATMHSDEIVASSPMAGFGSIGVMRTIPTWMFKYYSSYYTDLYSDHSPNKNRGSREYDKNKSVQAWVDELNELAVAFQDEVKAARPLRGDVGHTLSGEMFRAKTAKNRGLIDGVGGYHYATKRLASWAAANHNF